MNKIHKVNKVNKVPRPLGKRCPDGYFLWFLTFTPGRHQGKGGWDGESIYGNIIVKPYIQWNPQNDPQES